MGHIELRDIADDDLDAVFEMMRDPEGIARAAFTAKDPDDRSSFDAWMARNRANPSARVQVVTEDGGFAGTAGTFSVDGDREITYWIARHAWGRGVATAVIELLIALEPERPLYARAAALNTASVAALRRAGFAEISRNDAYAPGVGRNVEEIVFALLPTLDGN